MTSISVKHQKSQYQGNCRIARFILMRMNRKIKETSKLSVAEHDKTRGHLLSECCGSSEIFHSYCRFWRWPDLLYLPSSLVNKIPILVGKFAK